MRSGAHERVCHVATGERGMLVRDAEQDRIHVGTVCALELLGKAVQLVNRSPAVRLPCGEDERANARADIAGGDDPPAVSQS